MATVEITIPRMLADLVGGDRRFDVTADTVGGALEATVQRHPELRVHIFDESGGLRQHVSCFHNKRADRSGDAPVTDGDRIIVLQAVSGG